MTADRALLAQLEAAPWRFARTMPEHPHWYLLEREHPDLVARVRQAITERGYRARWGERTYRYVHLGGWKYWCVPPVLNREPVAT